MISVNRIPTHSFFEPIYTIDIAAKKTGITVHSIRLYEIEGFILLFKTDAGRRLYSDLELEKIRCIRLMIKAHGLNFEGIRRILSLVSSSALSLRICVQNSVILKVLFFRKFIADEYTLLEATPL